MTRASFLTTRWTLVESLACEQSTRSRALDELTRVYWPPVYGWLRRTGSDPDRAADLTQSFFLEVVLRRGLFDRAEISGGRLRTLILAALKRYRIDQHRRESARPDGGALSVGMLIEEETLLRQNAESDPERAFDRRWAVSVLEEALRRCERHFADGDRDCHWVAFVGHVLRPAVTQTESASYRDLAQELDFAKPRDVASAVQVVRRRVKHLLVEVVAETTTDSEDAGEELARIRELLT